MCVRACLRACVCACVRACLYVCSCVRPRVRVCVRACLRACVRACVRAYVGASVRAGVQACVLTWVRACVRAGYAVNKHSAAYKLSINAAKTNIMELDKWQENTNIVIDNINVERVQSFQYLGAMFTTNGDGASNIKQRLANAVQALNNMKYLWKSASKELKLKVMRTCIFPIATYGCETWVLRKVDIKRINAFEMKCYRKILRIPWIAHRTNCSISNFIYQRTGCIILQDDKN